MMDKPSPAKNAAIIIPSHSLLSSCLPLSFSTMDVFDFDDDQGVPSPATSPLVSNKRKRTIVDLSNKVPTIPLPSQEEAQPSVSQASSSTKSTGAEDPLKKGGRTRHARKKARKQETPTQAAVSSKQQEENNDGSKHVRFSKAQKRRGDNDAGSKFQPEEAESGILGRDASADSQTTGYSVSIAGLKRQRRTQGAKNNTTTSKILNRRQNTANNNSGSISSSCTVLGGEQTKTKSISLSEQIRQKLNQHNRQQHKLVPSPVAVVSRKVRGAGGNVYATQESGQFQMINDECHYLCSTIVACPLAQLLSKANIVESVADLAVLLSDSKTRRTLWRQSDGLSLTIEGILDVLQHTTTALAEHTQHRNSQRFSTLRQKLKASAKQNHQHDHDLMEPPQNRYARNIVEEYYAGLLLDSLAAMVSFLSWDCTIANKASAHYQTATGARDLRQAIMQHEGALTGILYIIRHADPVVSSILETVPQSQQSASMEDCDPQAKLPPPESPQKKDQLAPNYSQSQESRISSLNASPSRGSEAASIVSSQNGGDIDSTSVYTNASLDPTAIGRRKRRKRRGQGAVGAALECIAEEGSVISFTERATKKDGTLTSPPRSPPRVVFHKSQEVATDARTKLSFTTEDAMSPSRTPPRAHRGPAWRSGSSSQNDEAEDDGSSMVSCDSILLKIHDRLSTARARFVFPETKGSSNSNSASKATKQHSCQDHRELPLAFGGKDPAGSASTLALEALRRVIAGKEEGDEHSCLDHVDDTKSQGSSKGFLSSPGGDESMDVDDEDEPKHPSGGKAEEDEVLQGNPLYQTNRIIGESGVIPMLAQGVAETLAATMDELHDGYGSRTKTAPCQACLRHLHDKFQELAAVVDGACLLHDDNRVDFCFASFDDEKQDEANINPGLLIGSLVLFLKTWLQQNPPSTKGRQNNGLTNLMGEMGMSALRTLVSLTHDNSLAAEQLSREYVDAYKNRSSSLKKKSAAVTWSGAQLIGQVLHQASTKQGNEETKLIYDTRIFCLNTLANVVGDDPDGGIRRLLLELQVLPISTGLKNGSSSERPLPFLTWLSRWLVGQTKSFRDSIMKGSFGGSSSTAHQQHHSVRELEKHEDDLLNTAGNGCVLLACLLTEVPNPSVSDKKELEATVQSIRELILAEMPLDESTGLPSGTVFIKNTLRAFSNFLYFSMGDLSVAVVAPVRKLLDKLEKIQVETIMVP